MYGSNNSDPILLTSVVPIVLGASLFSALSHLCLSFNCRASFTKRPPRDSYVPLKCHFQCGTRLLSTRCSGSGFLIEDPRDSSRRHRRRRWKTAPRGRFNRLFLGRLSVVIASVVHRGVFYLYSAISSSDVALRCVFSWKKWCFHRGSSRKHEPIAIMDPTFPFSRSRKRLAYILVILVVGFLHASSPTCPVLVR